MSSSHPVAIQAMYLWHGTFLFIAFVNLCQLSWRVDADLLHDAQCDTQVQPSIGSWVGFSGQRGGRIIIITVNGHDIGSSSGGEESCG